MTRETGRIEEIRKWYNRTCLHYDERNAIEFLLSRLDLAEKVIEAARKARCDSFSGMNCEEDCANKILPKALAEWDKREKE